MNSATRTDAPATGYVGTRAAQTVERALDVVDEILDEGGEMSLRLADVSSRSGVSIGSIYHHFGSRTGLIEAARERQFTSSLPSASDLDFLADSTSPEVFVVRFFSYLGTGASASSRRRRLELLGGAASRPQQAATIRTAHTRFIDDAQAIAQGFKDRGWFRPGVDARAFAWFLHSMAMGDAVVEFDTTDYAEWQRLAVLAFSGIMMLDPAAVTFD
jgi:AcrR family transcriptional regulator